MYQSVRENHKPSPDWRLPVVTVFGIALLAALGGAIFAVMRTQYLYNRFRTDLLFSTVYAERNDTFTVYDGDEVISRVIPESFRSALGGQGRPTKAPQEGADITITFGDSSSIRIWESPFADYSKGHGAVWKPGILLEYTNADGRRYVIEREDDFAYLRFWLSGQIADYYRPTDEELALFQAFLDEAS